MPSFTALLELELELESSCLISRLTTYMKQQNVAVPFILLFTCPVHWQIQHCLAQSVNRGTHFRVIDATTVELYTVGCAVGRALRLAV